MNNAMKNLNRMRSIFLHPDSPQKNEYKLSKNELVLDQFMLSEVRSGITTLQDTLLAFDFSKP